MPVYEYACKACGHHLEVSQSFTDEPLTACPVCGGQLRKVFNSIGIVLKGSGFYRTDSRTPAKPEKAKAEKGEGEKGKAQKGADASSGDGAGAAAKSDGKADGKADAKPAESKSKSA